MPIQKLEGFAEILNIVGEIGSVAETMSEDTSARDRGGSMAAGTGKAGGPGTTARELAIAHLPPPDVMQRELEKYIHVEVKKLHRQARTVALARGPGTAYHLNLLYARIRQFNILLGAILEAGAEVLKRFFVRVFIDRQPIL